MSAKQVKDLLETAEKIGKVASKTGGVVVAVVGIIKLFVK